MNDETIDHSVCLKRGDPVIGEYRLAKGDISNDNGKYFQKFPHIIDWMLDRKIIDDHQHHAGYKLITMKFILGNVIGTQKSNMSFQHGDGTIELCAATLYSRIMRKMHSSGDHIHVLDKILFGNTSDKDKGWIIASKYYIYDAFEKLLIVLDKEIKNMLHCDNR